MKKQQYIKRNFLVLCIIISTVVVHLLPLSVLSASTSILEVAAIPQEGDKSDKEYEFIAKFTEGVTEISVFGDGWRELPFSYEYEHTSMSIIPDNSQKGEIGVVYKNVGVKDGIGIDLRITIADWEQYTNEQYNISYQTNQIGLYTQGYSYVDQIWEYVEHGTDKRIEVSGFMTVNDIDDCQFIQFDAESSQAIDEIYVSGTDNWIKFSDEGGEYKFYSAEYVNADEEDEFAMFTFTYKNRSSIRFKWGQDFERMGRPKTHTYDKALSYGAHFIYSAYKPLATATASPTKHVSDLDETMVKENRLQSRQEIFTYTVYHTVPDEWKSFYYSSYVFEDIMSECLEVQAVKIFDLSGSDVSDWFEIGVSDRTVTAAARELNNSRFYFNTYRFDISVSIKADADLSEYLSADGKNYVFANKASVTIDGDKAHSNEVKTAYAVSNLDDSIQKYIMDAEGEYVCGIDAEDGEKISFWGNVSLSNARVYSSIVITDHLHDSLEFQQMTVYDVSGTDITEWGTVTAEENIVKFTVQAEFCSYFQGTDFSFLIEAQLSADADFSDTENGAVTNHYLLSLDDKELESNEVIIHVPIKENQIEKFILDSSGEETTSVKLENDNQQDIVFTGHIQITNGETIEAIILEDILHQSLNYKDMTVYDADGNDITSNGKKDIEDQSVRILFDGDFARELVGEQLRWELIVTCEAGEKVQEGQKIENKMSLSVNENDTESNIVEVITADKKETVKAVSTGEVPETGDYVNNIAWIIIIGCLAGSVILVAVKNRKHF